MIPFTAPFLGWRLACGLALAIWIAAPVLDGPQGPGDGWRPPTWTEASPGGCVLPRPQAQPRPEPRGTWIWPSAEPAQGEQAYFQHVFRLDARPVRATLLACCDDAFELRVNGRSVAASSSWYQPVRSELAEHLAVGLNELRVAARNAAGPAGLLLELAIDLEDGGRVHVVSDEGWICTNERPLDWDASALGRNVWWRPHAFGFRGVAPWGEPGEVHPLAVPPLDGAGLPPEILQPERLRQQLETQLEKRRWGATILPPLRVTPGEVIDPDWLRQQLEKERRRRSSGATG